MEKIFEIVQTSAALEGCTLTMAECNRLLSEGISSEGKTIAEQLLCINLRNAYERCFQMAEAHEFWSPYRIKSLAALALRDAGASGSDVSDERVLQKVCDIANERHLHIGRENPEKQYKASFEIHYLISQHKPWRTGNDYLARLLMNYLQFECGLEPTVISASWRGGYQRILAIAKAEEIGEIFVSYMAGEKKAEPVHHKAEPVRKSAVAAHAVATVAKLSSRDRIMFLLKGNPYLSAKDLADEIGISAKGVEKQLGLLKSAGLLRRIGPDKGGSWEVL